jgi:CubicO group peptidase (beta-lactamase class C family)
MRRRYGGLLGALLAALYCMVSPALEPAFADPRSLPPTRIDNDVDLARAVDAYLAPLLRTHEISGVLLIGNASGIRVARAYAMADYERGIPNNLETVFRIGSVTKTFTAAATELLSEHGLLDLDDPLSRFLPDFPRAGEITIRQLLAHRSGVQNPDYLDSFGERIGIEALVRRIASKPLRFDPGSQNAYSSGGYNLLAGVIEKASGGTYHDFLLRQIAEPLGLTATGHPTEGTSGLATGHVPGPPPAWMQPVPWSDITGFSLGSGSLYSSAPDLWSWGRAVAEERAGRWKDLPWPYGWGRVEIGEHRGIEQTGAVTGFMSNLLVFPDSDVIVVALHNLEYGAWSDFGRDLAALAMGESREASARSVPVAVSPTDLRAHAGSYASGGTTLHVRLERDHLWLYGGEWPVGKYLAPLSESRFVPRSDTGEIRFSDPVDGRSPEFIWDFGTTATTFSRTD